MRTLSLVFLGTLIVVIAAATSRRAPTAPVASESPTAASDAIPASESPASAATPRWETSSRPTAAATTPFSRPTVSQAALEPMQELEREVGLEDWQRENLASIITERQAALRQAFADALREGKGEAGACAAVEKVFGAYEPRILTQFSAIQQAKYVEGRRAGTIGRPMLVYTYDEEF